MSTTPDPQLLQERREDCRRQVRRFLAERLALAHHPRVIQRRLNEGHSADFSEEEVREALAFLLSAEQAFQQHDSLGSTPYYQVTSAGVLAHERDPR